ncbi:O-methyltransferase [Bacillus suaedaesalsae]|uniref:tRNA 5-hydroxyuridine methyltransferase n=1 Tax=Bacillus suaedaesalsae TaxID=2810349 RepID=A0ABS2DMJ5_9BACI|nr:O-methyltransferase [Bacillus suaedaesalsae]MBM6619683.1 O-methyltransferase [Bacillus suaedaesalsae]
MVPSEMEQYLHALIPEREPLLMEIERYAKENEVPIMELIGIEALMQFLRLIEPTSILEVGSAIGYSALRMAKTIPNVNIVTIERDQERYDRALYYIDRANAKDQIEIILGDALEVSLTQTFDVIFIDAAKGQYTRFFEKYEKLLNDNGVIISDNVLFKGFVAMDNSDKHRRTKSLIKKIHDYNTWLMQNPNYNTTILPIGDGIAISKKKRVTE